MAELLIDSLPPLEHPAIVVGFSGWPDAAEVGSGAVAYLILAHVTETPPTFKELGLQSWVSTAVEKVVLSCLEKDPADRPQSANELADRFNAAVVAPHDSDPAEGCDGSTVTGREIPLEPDAAAKFLGVEQRPVLQAARDAIAGLDNWSAAGIEAALRHALIDGMGLKPRVAFGSVRVAVTGRTVSPPLFESIELLGKVETLSRLDAALSL